MLRLTTSKFWWLYFLFLTPDEKILSIINTKRIIICIVWTRYIETYNFIFSIIVVFHFCLMEKLDVQHLKGEKSIISNKWFWSTNCNSWHVFSHFLWNCKALVFPFKRYYLLSLQRIIIFGRSIYDIFRHFSQSIMFSQQLFLFHLSFTP